MGYGEDIGLLGLLTHNEKKELLGQLKLAPGHSHRMMEMFKHIEQQNPKPALKKQISQAL